MTAETLYYQEILDIIRDYLGPAAERFVNRQTMTHLHKKPTDLEKNDIPMLAIRLRSGLLVLTRDEAIVDEAYRRISALADSF